MAIEIKADPEEFALAQSNGAVYGKIIRSAVFFVYAELGTKIIYKQRRRDDPNTEYKKFSGCTIYYAENLEKLDRGEFESSTKNCEVIILC